MIVASSYVLNYAMWKSGAHSDSLFAACCDLLHIL